MPSTSQNNNAFNTFSNHDLKKLKFDHENNFNIEIITRTAIASQLTAQNQTDLLNDLGSAELNDHQVKKMMKER